VKEKSQKTKGVKKRGARKAEKEKKKGHCRKGDQDGAIGAAQRPCGGEEKREG